MDHQHNQQPGHSHNPYQTPTAQVTVSHAVDASTLIENGRAVPASHGIAWISAGWEAFKAFPGAWMLFFIVFMLVMLVLSIIPLINMLSIFITPVLMGGIMLACRDVDEDQPPSLNQLFSCFSTHLGPLALVGLMYLIGIVAMFIFLGIMAALIFGGGFMSGAGLQNIGPGLILLVLTGLLLAIPLAMSFYYAPALIVFHEIGVLDAMKTSFYGSLKNFLAFLIYGIVALVLTLLGMIPLFLGLLVTAPILIYSMYASYKDIYVA